MTKGKKIKRLFIANRGEVCRRIALTAKRLGISATTILLEKRSPLYLAGLIDRFVSPQDVKTNPYLNIEEMIRCAVASGADAIHPGFGFLSENDEFARACVDAGLIWVGPHAESIKAMASKAAARTLAEASKLPLTPGLKGIELKNKDADFKKIREFAKDVGLPVLVKAAYGGGGKGMRIVSDASQIEDFVNRCHSEAKSSFGNGELLVERYITAPRHVEVQILGDKHGQVFAVGDRDCSLQRRHQKVIEEAPAPDLNAATRSEMHAAAVNLAKKVRYDSAGTVEFLVDASVSAGSGKRQPFYFLEMNTRLQVEHPVTEEVYGLDLVEWQLRVAVGEKLPDLSKLEARGASIEARVYAEDPGQNFLPSPGRIDYFSPAIAPGIRWELGVDQCDVITTNYDPMIAKCVATAATREAALERLDQALRQTVFCGPKNNICFLRNLLTCSEFRAGAVTTHFIQDQGSKLITAAGKKTGTDVTLDALLARAKSFQGAEQGPSLEERAAAVFSRGGERPKQKVAGEMQRLQHVSYRHVDDEKIAIDYSQFALNHMDHLVFFHHVRAKSADSVSHWIMFDGETMSDMIQRQSLSGSVSQQQAGSEVKAPVPGKIISVRANAGQSVDKDSILMVLESMKMEFEVKAGRPGKVQTVLVKSGNQVSAGQTLLIWEN